MMMQNSDEHFLGDNLFKDMLSDYAAPVADEGFSQNVLAAVEAATKREERIRRVSIYGASFVGGLIAASQFPALLAMAAKVNIAVPALPGAGGMASSQWSLAALVLLGFVLWAALDRKASEIF